MRESFWGGKDSKKEAQEMIMCSESEDGSSFSPENSDTEEASEVETDQLESNESRGEMDEAMAKYRYR